MTTPTSESKPFAPGDVVVHVFARTDVGRSREHNEDAFLVADLSTGNATLRPEVRTHVVGERGTLFMVADGLGGAAAGELASEMAVQVVLDVLRQRWGSSPKMDAETFAAALTIATEQANTRIHQYALEHPEHKGLGTTATIAGLLRDTLYVVQIGDSRAYVIRDGKAQQITKDQSLMQRLVEAGEITAEEAEQSERRNIILQALGPEPTVKIDLTFQKLRRGDILVLCTDGLSTVVKKEEIADTLANEPDLVAACKQLIDRANNNGGPDNITVVAARFDGPGLDVAAAEDKVGHAVFPLPGLDSTPTQPTIPFLRPSALPPPAADADLFARSAPGGGGRRASRALLLAVAAVLLLAALLFAMRELRQPQHAPRTEPGGAAGAAAPALPTTTP